MTILILTPDGIYAARDRMGRTPIVIGKKEDAFCASFESFAYINLGYSDYYELGPGEIVFLTPEGMESLVPAREEMKICSFLWVYYGYPTSSYEGINVENMRYECGKLLARRDDVKADMVAGVPDSGIAHAIGYANESGIPFARPFIKYTPTWPRSFMPQNQGERNLIAKMKLIPVDALIRGKSMLLIDDSIVRGTTCGRIVKLLREAGAKEVHFMVSSPPFRNPCYFGTDIDSRDKLIACRMTIPEIAKSIDVDSLHYLSVDGVRAIAEGANCGFCVGCFTGEYPVDVPGELPKDKFECKISDRDKRGVR